MIDLTKLLSDSLIKLQSEGKIEALFEKHLTEALNSVISSLFSYNSDIRKELEKVFKEQIKVDLSQITIPEYNKMILVMIQKMIDSNTHEQGLKKLETDLKKMLSTSAPIEIKVSELIQEFANHIHEDDDCWDGEISFICEMSTIPNGYFDFYIDQTSGKRKYDCDYNVHCDNEGVIHQCTIARCEK